MNLRALSLAVAVASIAATTASGQAQGTYPPAAVTAPTDGGVPVSVDQMNAAITGATPQDCGGLLPDTLNGSTGTTRCMTHMGDTRPTVVQAGNVVTDASGNWSITFAKPFVSQTPYVHAEPITPGASLPFDCNVTARSATSAQGTCYQSVSTTLGGSLAAVLGTVISPFKNAGAGITVMIIARESTQ